MFAEAEDLQLHLRYWTDGSHAQKLESELFDIVSTHVVASKSCDSSIWLNRLTGNSAKE
jgi:hypothetical protein